MSHGADIWAAVDVQGPSSAVKVPSCWSAAPKAETDDDRNEVRHEGTIEPRR